MPNLEFVALALMEILAFNAQNGIKTKTMGRI